MNIKKNNSLFNKFNNNNLIKNFNVNDNNNDFLIEEDVLNEKEKLINDILKKKKVNTKEQFKEEFGKINYSYVKINYFKKKAVKHEESKDINVKDFRIFSLLQHEILYNDFLIKKFVNFLIKDGKKYLAYKNFELALSILKQITHQHPLFFLRYNFYLNEQFFDYKNIISKKSKKIIFVFPKFVEGKARWLKPLKLWIKEFFYDQAILYKLPLFRKFYIRLAFTLYRLYKKHSFLIRKYIEEKNIVVTQHYKKIHNIFENKKRKRKIMYFRTDKDTKWNWTQGRYWKNRSIEATTEYNETNIWNNKLFEYEKRNMLNRGAIKTRPRKLKKKNVHKSFPWFGK